MVVVDADILTSGSTLLELILISLLVAVGLVTQARSLVMMTVTISPSFNVEVLKVGASVPLSTPLTCHWYDGLDPPFVGVAVKVTDVPSQIDVVLALIETSGSTLLELMVISLLSAVGLDTQARSLVMMTVTTSPSFNEDVVNLGESVPLSTPLTCHWYEGLDPPLVGVAVKVTDVPSQIVVVEADMLTSGSTLLELIVISLLV